MPLDGLTVKALINELQSRLKNGRLIKIYQPDDFTLTLELRLPGRTEILLISADPTHPRIHTLDSPLQNPLNPPAFCMLLRKHLEPSRLLEIQQQGWDRQIHLRFECLDEQGKLTQKILIFELMGRHSNIFLVDQKGQILDVIRRFPENNVAPGHAYRPPSDQGKLEPTSVDLEQFLTEIRLLPPPTLVWRGIQNFLQGFSKTAAQEVVRRAGLPDLVKREKLVEADWERLYASCTDLIAEIKAGGHPAWYPRLNDFAAYKLLTEKGEDFSSVDALIGSVFGEKVQERELTAAANTLRRQVNTHYKRVLRKEELQLQTLAEAQDADQWRHLGELLTASFHLIPSKEKSVQVPDYTQPDQPLVEIPLDPSLSPSANVQRIFKRYNKAKASQKFTRLQLQKTKAERRYLEDILSQIELADDPAILQTIRDELSSLDYLPRQKRKQRKENLRPQGPDRYLSPDGITVLVGRNNRQNDELTFRLTSPKSLWLHAKDVPGSHVSILHEGEIPEDTLEFAATLAAYFSQLRSSPKAAVDYTQRRYVRKPRGANPGFVHYDQFKTIIVDPTQFSVPPKI